jgi:hypothetical protein
MDADDHAEIERLDTSAVPLRDCGISGHLSAERA